MSTDAYSELQAVVAELQDAKGSAFGILTADENSDVPVTGYPAQPSLAKRFKAAFDVVADATTRADLANATDPAKGAGLVGYKSLLAFAVAETVRQKIDQMAKTPYTFGAVGDGIANDTQAVVRALEAGYAYFEGTFFCDPFEIVGRRLDVTFAPGSKLVFTHQGSNSAVFTGCSGVINGIEIDDAQETVAGVYVSMLINSSANLTVNRPRLVGGKDLPVVIFQSDNCHVVDGFGLGSESNRPFAWEIISSKACTFTRCYLYTYQFGFALIGPGYKSGPSLPSTRAWEDTLGMQAVDCYVEDHTGHAFDMNGTVGGRFSGCTARRYTGSEGNSSFQVKQSTNIPEELADATYHNTVTGCWAIDCVDGFGTQQGTDVIMSDNHVVRCKRYPVRLNSTKRPVVNGLQVRDWGMDLASWPLLNADTVCAAVAIWSGSDDAVIDNVTTALVDPANPGIASLALCNVVGSNAQLGAFRFRREAGVTGQMARALRISGNNTIIGEGFRIGDPAFYASHPIEDLSISTTYPLQFGVSVPLNANGTYIMPSLPQRGMLVCKVASLVTTAPSGSPQYAVGRNGSTAQFIAARPVQASGTEFLDPLTGTLNPNLALAVQITAGTGGQLSVSARGVHLL